MPVARRPGRADRRKTATADRLASERRTTIGNFLAKVSTGLHALLYRLLGGTAMGAKATDGGVIVVTTTGAKSGKRRSRPLMHVKDGDRYVVTASAGGGPNHPAWYHNMLANPGVVVQDGDRVLACRARPAEGAERDALWERFVASDDRFARYEARTSRAIPVMALEPE